MNPSVFNANPLWHQTVRRIAAGLASALLSFAALAGAPEPGLFELATGKPSTALITVDDKMPAGELTAAEQTSPMLLNLRGVVASLSAPQVNLLVDAARGSRPVQVTPEFRRIGVAQLLDRSGKVAKRVELLVGPAAVIAGRELSGDPPASTPAQGAATLVTQIDADKFRKLSASWSLYRSTFDAGGIGLSIQTTSEPLPKPATTEPLAKPAPALVYLDERTFSDRFLSGGTARPLKPVRVLSQEKFYLRPPAGYDPAKPVGLLIWINAMNEGRPPELFNKALDELGIACVGIDNAGNDRPVVDRFQLALDALFAASERVHVDPRRVYLTGVSGGGRTTTRLACCFPDYFTGAVPIVGLSAYFDVPLGNGKHSPAGFDRPNSARFTLLRTRRIGAITGDKDFNHDEMVAIVERFTKDKVQARLFDHENYGHQMPSPDQFAEAIKWVDGPYKDAAQKERAAAQSLLDTYITAHGDAAPPAGDTKARNELVKITQMAPWSEPAWRAVKLLRGPAPAAPATDSR